jgi:neutral ceramidase
MTARLFRLLAVALLIHVSTGTVRADDAADAANGWQAGFGRVVFTPDERMWLSGYGGRDRPSEGKVHDLYARAAALRDPQGRTAVFIATDLVGVPLGMTRAVSEAAGRKHGLERADLMFTCSHTHCGPALDDKLSHMLAMDEDDWAKVRVYQETLNARVIEAVDEAIADLQPARLSMGNGACGFAANRRPPIGQGPYDHDVPVLRVSLPDGALRGVIFGYACHATTLNIYEWCGDYPGFAALYLEERHPGATALFFAGCGADQNPLPRRKLELAEKYGRMLAVAVEEVLASEMTPITGTLKTDLRHIDLEFDALPTKEDLEADLKGDNRFARARAALLLEEIASQGELSKTYPYPIQVWEVGDELTWVALAGEVVVDYSLRLKRELGRERTWVAGYANDVMAYIPSERVLKEGGYEGGGSMLYYQLPTNWKAGLENRIVETVHAMSRELRGEQQKD